MKLSRFFIVGFSVSCFQMNVLSQISSNTYPPSLAPMNPYYTNNLASYSIELSQYQLTYQGGPLLPTSSIQPIFYGNWTETQQGIINNFLQGLPNTNYLGILSRYYQQIESAPTTTNVNFFWYQNVASGVNINLGSISTMPLGYSTGMFNSITLTFSGYLQNGAQQNLFYCYVNGYNNDNLPFAISTTPDDKGAFSWTQTLSVDSYSQLQTMFNSLVQSGTNIPIYVSAESGNALLCEYECEMVITLNYNGGLFLYLQQPLIKSSISVGYLAGNTLQDYGETPIPNIIAQTVGGVDNLSSSVLYLLLLDPSVTFFSNSNSSNVGCSDAGYHWNYTESVLPNNGLFQSGYSKSSLQLIDITYSVVSNPMYPGSSSGLPCITQNNQQYPNQVSSPNNDVGVDGMISTIAHEIMESYTNSRSSGWVLTPNEIGDICQDYFIQFSSGNFGTRAVTSTGAQYNMFFNGNAYLVQRIWANGNFGDDLGACVMGCNITTGQCYDSYWGPA